MKNLIAFTFLSLFALIASSQSSSAQTIEMAKNLQQDGLDATNNKQPIVLFMTAEDCPYCEQLRQEYFKFSTTDSRFILREIEQGVYHDVVNFNGRQANHQLIADRYNVFLTPTIVFVDANGMVLTKPIVGILTMDYYHFYFEKALKTAIIQMGGTWTEAS